MSNQAAKGVSIRPVTALPFFKAGDDVAAAIISAMMASQDRLSDGDVVVVAQKIVSKAEGRAVKVSSVDAGTQAHEVAALTDKEPKIVELALRESSEVVRAHTGVLIMRHTTGQVLANAGIDASNVEKIDGEEAVLLWPKNPDASAQKIRMDLQAAFGARIAVVISDSLGRAWRMGTAGTAIGVAGMSPLRDRRGEHDLFGRELQATVIGVADEIAAAASLVIGEAAEGSPVAIVTGAAYTPSETGGIEEIVR
ncbi:MAG: coenzyme F420-0:L-glutamate ligase, partial [Caulobacterales bacterium]